MRKMSYYILAMFMVLWAIAVQAQTFNAGQQYQILPAGLPPLANTAPHQVVVTEFFSFACPHCFAEQTYIDQWLKTKPANVIFQRIPVGFGNSQWVALAKAYYVIQALGKTDVLMPAIFNAIHVQGMPLFTENALAEFCAHYGIPVATFKNYYQSFSINQQVRAADQSLQAYGILAVPTIVVGNHYVTDAGSAGSAAQLMPVVSYLVQLSLASVQS